MLLENTDGTAFPPSSAAPPEQQSAAAAAAAAAAAGCDVISGSQPASPAGSDVTAAGSDVTAAGQLAGRLSDAWDVALSEIRLTEPPVDDPLHRDMLVFWVEPQEVGPSELPPTSLIALVSEDGTLSDVDYPVKIGDYTFLVPEEQNSESSDSGSDDSDEVMKDDTISPPPAAQQEAARQRQLLSPPPAAQREGDKQRRLFSPPPTTQQEGARQQRLLSPPPAAQREVARQRRLLAAHTDISDGLFIDCTDYDQYARALLDAEVTVVRNVLAACCPESERDRSLLYGLQTVCERRWREEPALDIVDKLGCELAGNRGLVGYLVSHMRLLLQTMPELGKLQNTLLTTLQAELLRIQKDFLTSRIAARAWELRPPPVPAASGADRPPGPAEFSDVNPTPFGPFGSPPRPQRWGW